MSTPSTRRCHHIAASPAERWDTAIRRSRRCRAWCERHRRSALGAWVVVLVLTGGLKHEFLFVICFVGLLGLFTISALMTASTVAPMVFAPRTAYGWLREQPVLRPATALGHASTSVAFGTVTLLGWWFATLVEVDFENQISAAHTDRQVGEALARFAEAPLVVVASAVVAVPPLWLYRVVKASEPDGLPPHGVGRRHLVVGWAALVAVAALVVAPTVAWVASDPDRLVALAVAIGVVVALHWILRDLTGISRRHDEPENDASASSCLNERQLLTAVRHRLDVHAKTYRNDPERIVRRVRRYIDMVTTSPDPTPVLEIVVPPGASPSQQDALDTAVALGESRGVSVRLLVTHG